ncbi:MAG: biotin transporter BioY [Pseudobdellovibrionaceae bacterium]
MIRTQAVLPRILSQQASLKQSEWIMNVVTVGLGVSIIALLAQVSISLPFTPVPITGQTFGVALISLLWGWKRAVVTTLAYLTLGAAGLPIFALGKTGLMMGPTLGYLVGMVIASLWMGFLADRGWTKSFLKSWIAATSGSVIVFTFGLFVLSFFVPASGLLMAGLFPFIPGDIIKTLLVATFVSQADQRI